MKVLVTGSAGFVGRHLCQKLYGSGYTSSPGVGYSVAHIDPIRYGCGYSPPGGTVNEFIEAVPRQTYDIVVHLAANIVNVDQRMKMGMKAFDDIELDLAMCRWLEKNPPTKCVVLMSSCAVDFPADPYCIVKRNLEAMGKTLQKQGVPVIILRPFSGYGEDQSEEYPFPAILGRALRQEDPLTVWGGFQVRDWLHIDDLTDAILFAIENVTNQSVPIEVGTKRGTSIRDLAYLMANAVGYQPTVEGMLEKASSSRCRVAGRNKESKLLQEWGWEPKISLEEGIKRAVAHKLATV